MCSRWSLCVGMKALKVARGPAEHMVRRNGVENKASPSLCDFCRCPCGKSGEWNRNRGPHNPRAWPSVQVSIRTPSPSVGWDTVYLFASYSHLKIGGTCWSWRLRPNIMFVLRCAAVGITGDHSPRQAALWYSIWAGWPLSGRPHVQCTKSSVFHSQHRKERQQPSNLICLPFPCQSSAALLSASSPAFLVKVCW